MERVKEVKSLKQNNMIKKITPLLIVIAFVVSMSVQAQEKIPFWNEVQALKHKDSIQFPAANQILFIGSSSFTKWKDVQNYFPDYPILNRAFGGSMLVDLIRFRYDIIYPYQPRQIVMYCGENDFASSDSITVDIVFNRFVTVYNLIRAKYPDVPFLYVSMKPSPSRVHLLKKFEAANSMIDTFLQQQANCSFADIYSKMLLHDGMPMPDIFIQDNLHMNAKGYAIWQKTLAPFLMK